MHEIITGLGNGVQKVLSGLEEWSIQSFLDWANETAKDFWSNEKALKMAKEGTKEECFQERLKMLAKDFKDDINRTSLFTEEELRRKFHLLYENLDVNSREHLDGINEEELFKCFEIYATEYTKYLEKELSMGERRLLERTAVIDNKLDKVLTKEDFEKRAKAHANFLKILCKDQNKPFIHITDNQMVSVEEFQYKYTFFNNTYDFVASHESDPLDDDSYVVTFCLKNAGKTVIEDIQISDFVLRYCTDIYDDDPQYGYYIFQAAEYNTSIQNALNIVPGCDQKLHIIFRMNSEEQEDEGYHPFFDFYEYDRIQLWFTLTAKNAKETLKYDVIISLGIVERFDGNSSITGTWEVDDVSMIDAKCRVEE